MDDRSDVRDLVRGVVEGEPGLEVVAEAEDGQMAIEAAREHAPDVIVMDFLMPVMNGLEATRQIKAEMPHIQIVAMTSADHPAAAKAFQDAGVAGYVRRASMRDLVSVLREIGSKQEPHDEPPA